MIHTDNNETKRFPADAGTERGKTARPGKPYIFYCVMTLSVMLFTLAFAASELFSLFFSAGYPGGMIMSRLFGPDGGSGKSFGEILLDQSFTDLSLYKGEKTSSDAAPVTDKIPDKTSGDTSVTEDAPSDTDEPETTAADTPDTVPDGMKNILAMDLSLSEYGNGYISDQSGKNPDLSRLDGFSFSTGVASVYPKNSPVVLIVHTHATEAFTPGGVGYYDPDKETARSADNGENVVALGKRLSDELNAAGIPTVHCETRHDLESYSGAYSRSAESIVSYLEKYPTVQYVIDLHRDSIVRSTGELVKPLAPDGETAQLMFVVGTAGAVWERNLALAQTLREKLNSELAGSCRPTCLRESSYNQQYAPYSVLVEVGAAGNTLDEAKRAVDLFSDVLAKIIKDEY